MIEQERQVLAKQEQIASVVQNTAKASYFRQDHRSLVDLWQTTHVQRTSYLHIAALLH